MPLVVVVLVASVAGLSVASSRAGAAGGADVAVRPVAVSDPTGRKANQEADVVEAPSASTPATPLFANVAGVYLRLPAEDIVVLGFHEAATREAMALSPVGTVDDHQNTTKFEPPPDDASGSPYVVLSSRGRPMPATSAADLVLPEGVAVRAPVDGEVTDVREYFLYGKHLDQRVEIAPAANPDLRVVLIHLDGTSVEVGDQVVAGDTVVAAQARRFPFASHIDRYTEPDRHGHVHLEVKPAGAPESQAAGTTGTG